MKVLTASLVNTQLTSFMYELFTESKTLPSMVGEGDLAEFENPPFSKDTCRYVKQTTPLLGRPMHVTRYKHVKNVGSF